jgi:hypothetical protein
VVDNGRSYDCISETNRMHLVLFGIQKRTFGPYLAANNRILISVMPSGHSASGCHRECASWPLHSWTHWFSV